MELGGGEAVGVRSEHGIKGYSISAQGRRKSPDWPDPGFVSLHSPGTLNLWGGGAFIPKVTNPEKSVMEMHILPEQWSLFTLESPGSVYLYLGPFPQSSDLTGLELGLGTGMCESSQVILMCCQSWAPLTRAVGTHQLGNSYLTLCLDVLICPEGCCWGAEAPQCRSTLCLPFLSSSQAFHSLSANLCATPWGASLPLSSSYLICYALVPLGPQSLLSDKDC